MNKKDKKEMIGFILSSRAIRDKAFENDNFYQQMFNYYLIELDDDEIKAEFDYYVEY